MKIQRDIIKVSQHPVQKQEKPCKCYNFAGRHKGTIIRIKSALNSAGSMVGIAWVTLCWGVMVCIRVGHADGDDCLPCQTAHRHIPNMGS